MCFLALSRSDNRLDSFRISKFPAGRLTSVKPDSVVLVDCGILDVVGLETGGILDVVGLETGGEAMLGNVAG